MIRFLLFFIFIFAGIVVKGQSNIWYFHATIGTEFSYYKSPFNVKEPEIDSLATDRSVGFNYQLGGIVGRPINQFLSFESGLHLLIRGDKNIDRTFACDTFQGSRRCAGLPSSIQKKRYHILEIPLRIRLQQNIFKKHSIYLAGAYSNYIYYATIYDSGAYESISNRIHYAFSFNMNMGWEYQLHPKWLIGLDINARVFERRQRDEARLIFGQEEKNYQTSFDNINIGIICKYQIF